MAEPEKYDKALIPNPADVLDVTALSALRGDSGSEVTERWLRQMQDRVLVVQVLDGPMYPKFQFTADGELAEQVSVHVQTLRRAGLGPNQVWSFLTEQAGLLSGAVPVELIRSNPDRVTKAVQRLATRVREAGRGPFAEPGD